MTPNDSERHRRELQGDFSEADAYMRMECVKIGAAIAFLVVWYFLAVTLL